MAKARRCRSCGSKLASRRRQAQFCSELCRQVYWQAIYRRRKAGLPDNAPKVRPGGRHRLRERLRAEGWRVPPWPKLLVAAWKLDDGHAWARTVKLYWRRVFVPHPWDVWLTKTTRMEPGVFDEPTPCAPWSRIQPAMAADFVVAGGPEWDKRSGGPQGRAAYRRDAKW